MVPRPPCDQGHRLPRRKALDCTRTGQRRLSQNVSERPMISRTITPPPGSSISVPTVGAAPVITIPQPSGGAARFLVGAFLLFWLGGWFFGFSSASSQILAGKGGFFL